MWTCLNNPDNKICDVVICTAPWTDTKLPLMAPAALKPIVEKAGLSCLAVDLNMEVVNATVKHNDTDKFVKFFFDEVVDLDIEEELLEWFIKIAEGIVSFKPKWVGISLLSYACQNSTKWIAYFVKKLDPNIKIMVGGAGCLATFTGPSPWIEDMFSQQLIDYHIRGDAENSLYELLTGNTQHNGINSPTWTQLTMEDLSIIPAPDYSDYDFKIYEISTLPIIGSRGCVRQCTFCDYIANWKKFQWRTADHIFDEMLLQNKKYNIRNFKFQDALINGNLKEFKQLTNLLSEYNDANPNNSFKWSSFYIFREVTTSSETDWDLIARSGADSLLVGIENFNEHIRYAMGKKFSNSSIDFHIKQAQKYQISLVLGNIVGYINETEEDIEFIKEWLRTHTQYADVIKLQWGGTLGIFPNTHLEQNKSKLGIIMIGNSPQHWTTETNKSTPAVRARWVNELAKLSRQLGYVTFDNIDNHFILEKMMNE